jgi:hypothetical protein
MFPDALLHPSEPASRAALRPRRQAIDWLAIERDYRRGLLSLRQLAHKHGCSHSAIANFAGRHGWTRNPPLHAPPAGNGAPSTRAPGSTTGNIA